MNMDMSTRTSGSGLVSRSYCKTLDRIERSTDLSIARIDGEVQRQAAIIDGVAQVGATALRDVAQISQLEVQLAQLVPAAVSRLQAIGDMTALQVVGVVSDAARAMSRVR